MIAANELRIGNLIYNQGKGISRRIIAVSGNVILERTKGKIKLIEPIPITEEWLLKCGATKTKDYQEYSVYNITICQRYEDGKWVYRRIVDINGYDTIIDTVLNYVHTYQNFIYALTNKELTIKL